MSGDEKIIDVSRITKVIGDVIGYLEYVSKQDEEDAEACDAVQSLLVSAFIDKVQADNRICPF